MIFYTNFSHVEAVLPSFERKSEFPMHNLRLFCIPDRGRLEIHQIVKADLVHLFVADRNNAAEFFTK